MISLMEYNMTTEDENARIEYNRKYKEMIVRMQVLFKKNQELNKV